MTKKEPADKTRMFRTLLKGQALSYFEHHLLRRLDAEDSDVRHRDLGFNNIDMWPLPKEIGHECFSLDDLGSTNMNPS
jgi:hypothetical protein